MNNHQETEFISGKQGKTINKIYSPDQSSSGTAYVKKGEIISKLPGISSSTVPVENIIKLVPNENNYIKNVYNINNSNYLYWLGGFVEGEGYASISVVANKTFKFGIQLQPVFNVTQHVNGLNIYFSFL